jgi:hypothetical protein
MLAGIGAIQGWELAKVRAHGRGARETSPVVVAAAKGGE